MKQNVDTGCIDEVNDEGRTTNILFNNSRSQLWIDVAKHYGLCASKAQTGSPKFEEQCIIEQCYTFAKKITDTNSQTFIECSLLVVL